jgi:hypothetical protein
MTRMKKAAWVAAGLALCSVPGPGAAQGEAPAVDPATIPMPVIAFTPTPDAVANYDKYFIFNRADTDFATAYADLRECDGYARGLSYSASAANYGTTGVIAEVAADTIYGSAERRRQRRQNMLTCMGFKRYRAFGLPKEIWESFNFEEGNRIVPEGARQRMLQIQARVASGPAPTVGALLMVRARERAP